MNSNQIETAINLIAEKLQVPAGMVWGTLIKQASLEAAYSAVTAVIFCVLLVLFYRVKNALRDRYMEDKCLDNKTPYEVSTAFFWAFVILAFIMITLSVTNLITAALNPEYWALKELLSL